MSNISRLHNLDYLRGLSAFGIMIYHFFTWKEGEFYSNSFLGRVGIYGVITFYILSGITLYHVYYDRLKVNSIDILLFIKKRILRIFPLFWVATLVSIFLKEIQVTFYGVFLNLTGLFGLIKWNLYYATGAWSIGNELFFYLFFIGLIFIKKSRVANLITIVGIFLLFWYFTFYRLNDEKNILVSLAT